MEVLVTGGCGFIGSNFVRYLLAREPDARITNLDLLTYAGRRENLRDVEKDARYRFLRGDVADEALVQRLVKGKDAVLHFAAESHVDRSIQNARPFLHTNVLGTAAVLEACRRRDVHLVHVSTDEVYGSRRTGFFTEEDALNPSSPYSASKAAADHLCRAYVRTHGVSCTLVRPSNNYGPYQFPEKFVPVAVLAAIEDRPVPVYGDGRNVRDWLYVEDCCAAIHRVLEKGKRRGHAYNACSGQALSNLEIARKVLALAGRPTSRVVFVPDRPGHDFRYAMDASRLRALGWRPKKSLEEGLAATVAWYRENRAWWRPLLPRAGTLQKSASRASAPAAGVSWQRRHKP